MDILRADVKCPKCKTYRYPNDFLNEKNRILKTCINCRKTGKKSRENTKCEHKKDKAVCKECHGVSICEHGKRKQRCKECGGSQICEHNRRKSQCKECGGSQICEHNRGKYYCRDCNGKAFCIHNKVKRTCKECGGKGICKHNKDKRICKECDPIGHLSNTISTAVRCALKAKKSKRSIEYLGCSVVDFKTHIESQFKEGMNWDNHGEWHIDHITPLKYENPTIEEVMERLHWTNTQPLWATENISKSNRFIG